MEKFEQTPEVISIAVLDDIKKQCHNSEPQIRLENYMRFLNTNFTYDRVSVNAFYNSKNENTGFNYKDYFNVSKLLIKKTGACQQFAVALSMLCYDDPDINCYQTIVKINSIDDLNKFTAYKHSVNFVDISSKNKQGIVDVTNMGYYGKNIYSLKDYKEKAEQKHESLKYNGMAYYSPGHKLEDIFMRMQGFGEGIRFDFEGFEKEEKTFLDAFDQKKNGKLL